MSQWERLRGARLLMRGAMDARPLCTKTTAKAQRNVMVSCPSSLAARSTQDKLQHHRGDP